jgi:RNA polymerase sigma-70 factor (ECF subfamily)
MPIEPDTQSSPTHERHLADGTDDEALMRGVRQHDQQALATLYTRYGNMVYGLALHILKHQAQAEETTQDVFLKVWNKAAQWNPDRARLSTWLLAMTRNTAIDRLRHEHRRPDMNQPTPDKVINLVAVEGWQSGHQLRVLMQQLPPEQLQVIHLSFFGGMSQREMAAELGIPLGTIKTRMRLGLQKLRQMWLEESL